VHGCAELDDPAGLYIVLATGVFDALPGFLVAQRVAVVAVGATQKRHGLAAVRVGVGHRFPLGCQWPRGDDGRPPNTSRRARSRLGPPTRPAGRTERRSSGCRGALRRRDPPLPDELRALVQAAKHLTVVFRGDGPGLFNEFIETLEFLGAKSPSPRDPRHPV